MRSRSAIGDRDAELLDDEGNEVYDIVRLFLSLGSVYTFWYLAKDNNVILLFDISIHDVLIIYVLMISERWN